MFSIEGKVKYESPYSMDPPRWNSQSPSLKRRFSEAVDASGDGDEKRQRISVDSADLDDDFDIGKIAEAAAAAAVQQLSNPSTETTFGIDGAQARTSSISPVADTLSVSASNADINGGLSSDPHLYMRILSLPILESLVSDWWITVPYCPIALFTLDYH